MQYADSHVPGPSFRFTMVNWSDPAEITKDAGQWRHLQLSLQVLTFQTEVFQKVIFTLFGVYFWELFMTWDFELSLITKRRKFRWPLVSLFYELTPRCFILFLRVCVLLSV